MCGGEGSRLAATIDDDVEKPLFEIGGLPMIDRVLAALDDSRIRTSYAVVSPTAPETRAHLDERVPTIGTPGEGYVADLSSALATVERPVLTVAADLPLLSGDVLDDVLDRYANIGDARDGTEIGDARDGTEGPNRRGSMTVAVPVTLKERLGVSADTVLGTGAFDGRVLVANEGIGEHGERVAPTGLNVVGTGGDATDTLYLTDDERVAVNVNRARDATIAEAII